MTRLTGEHPPPRRPPHGGHHPDQPPGASRSAVRSVHVGDLAPAHRPRLATLLAATGAFSADEVGVALELFDEGVGGGGGLRDDATAHDAAPGETRPPDAARYRTSPPASLVPGTADGGGARVTARPAAPAPPTDSDYLFLGAFTPEDELVGYACYGPTPGTDRTFDLYWIAVEPATQGAGIGTLLLDEVERRLQGHHARLLVVETSSRSDYRATRRFYERRGYAEGARVRAFYAPGDDRIIYIKRFHAGLSRPPGGERSGHE